MKASELKHLHWFENGKPCICGKTPLQAMDEQYQDAKSEIARLRKLLQAVSDNTRECSHCDGTGSMLGARHEEACGVCGGYGFNMGGDIRETVIDIRAELEKAQS